MQIAILTFDGFNELDSFITAGILNRMSVNACRDGCCFAAHRALMPSRRFITSRP
jgi:hypothetical protein